MRLTKLIAGKTIWAGPSKVVRQDCRAVRINAPHPEIKEASLPQAVIARWPHNGLGINSASLANPIELPSLNWENWIGLNCQLANCPNWNCGSQLPQLKLPIAELQMSISRD
jgi:hypothetical protein